IPVIDRLRRRFDIARVCVVADRGTISTETMAELEARRLLYILGVRERSDKLVRALVLDDPAPFGPRVMKKRGKGIDYEAKTVMLAGRRYIVCRNRQKNSKASVLHPAHKLDETIRGHVFCSFFALVLKSELEERTAGLGRSGSWPQIIADLDSLTETEI